MEPFTVVLVALHAFLMVVGIPGNLLIILVTANRSTKKSVHVFIIALAVADLLACCLSPFGIHYWLNSNNYHYMSLCKIYIFTSFMTVFTTMFLTIAVAFDRYFAVCHPLKPIMNIKRTVVVCVGCFGGANLCTIPAVFAFGIRSYGPKVTMCTVTANPWLLEGVYGMTVFAFLLSTIVLTILYLHMCIVVRRQARVRARVAPAPMDIGHEVGNSGIETASAQVPVEGGASNSMGVTPGDSRDVPGLFTRSVLDAPNHANTDISYISGTVHNIANIRLSAAPMRKPRQDAQVRRNPNVAAIGEAMKNKTTKMLILSSVVFIVSWLPNITIKAMPSARYQLLTHSHPALLLVIRSFEYLFLINHAVNPFVYSLVNKRFRALCAQYINKLRRNVFG